MRHVCSIGVAAPGFAANHIAELAGHIARGPSYPERIIIARLIALEFELSKFDAKVDAGEELSGHVSRARLAAENCLRLDRATPAVTPSVGISADQPLDDRRYATKLGTNLSEGFISAVERDSR
jgi:hypothetical protein